MTFTKSVRLIRLGLIMGVSFAVFSAAPAFAEYKKNYIGEMQTYRAVYEDTLVHLARKFNLGFVELRAANPGLDPWIPGEGAEIILPTRHLLPDAPRKGIVINMPEMRVYSYLDSKEEPKTYAIGIGREGLETPFGKTTVVRKAEGPYWRPTPRMLREDPTLKPVVPPGPENPMGTHALYLGWPQYGIHGTNRPYGIGRRVSSGCIRMYPEAIIEFYNETPVGTQVNVINQPIKLAWIGNELFIEAHPDIEQAMRMEEVGSVEHQKMTEADMEQIIKIAGVHEDKLNWAKIRTAVRERKGYPIRIARIDGPAVKEDHTTALTVSDDKSSVKTQNRAKKSSDLKKVDAVNISYPKKVPRKPEDALKRAHKNEGRNG